MESGNLEQLISLIFKTQRTMHERMRKAMPKPLSSMLKLETLRYVAERQHPPMKEIADHLSITPPSATSLINALVDAGQLERIHDTKDRRLVRLRITQKGRKLLEKEFGDIVAYIKKDLSILNEQEIKNFIIILEKLSA